MANNENRKMGVYSESGDTQNPQASSFMEERSVREWLGTKLYRRTFGSRVSIVEGHRFVDFGAITDTTLGSYEMIYQIPKPEYKHSRRGRPPKAEKAS